MIGAAAMALAVGLGAFGAHGLKHHLDAQALGWWDTGTRYLAWHALGLLAIDRVAAQGDPLKAHLAGALMVAGIVLFSGSLYTMALTDQRWLGAVTPLGGTAWIVAWLALALAARKGVSPTG